MAEVSLQVKHYVDMHLYCTVFCQKYITPYISNCIVLWYHLFSCRFSGEIVPYSFDQVRWITEEKKIPPWDKQVGSLVQGTVQSYQ